MSRHSLSLQSPNHDKIEKVVAEPKVDKIRGENEFKVAEEKETDEDVEDEELRVEEIGFKEHCCFKKLFKGK